MYSPITFAISMLIAELPYAILCAVCFFLPLYYMPGFQTETSRAGYQFLMILITELFSVTLGQALAAITPSTFISSQFDPFIMITFALFCGVTIPSVQMPAFWRSWLFQLDPFTRLIGGMVVTALHDLPVRCRPWELNAFRAPDNASCGEYMRPFFDRGGSGYVVDPASQDCQYCAFGLGDEFYTPLGFSFDDRWRDLGIFLCYLASNLIIVFLAVRRAGRGRRGLFVANVLARAASSTSTSARGPPARRRRRPGLNRPWIRSYERQRPSPVSRTQPCPTRGPGRAASASTAIGRYTDLNGGCMAICGEDHLENTKDQPGVVGICRGVIVIVLVFGFHYWGLQRANPKPYRRLYESFKPGSVIAPVCSV